MRLFVFLLACGLCQGQTQGCTVEGQAVNNASGEPLRKVQILLRSLGSSSEPPYGGVSDSAGRFAITDVKPGRYALTAERAGFVRSEYGAQASGRRGATLNLSPGQSVKDAIFRLTPQGVIIGRGLDEDGDAVAGVQVQVMRYGYVQGKRTLLPAGSASTNDIGEYRIAGLSAGKYFVSADYHPPVMRNSGENYAPSYYPGTADPAAAAPVLVVPGNQVRGVDIALTRTRTVRVSGKVTNPGVASGGSRNVMIFLMPRDAGMRGFSSRNAAMVQDGRFEIHGVIPGSYLITAHWYEDGNRSTSSQPVEVGNAGLDNVVLTMSPGFDVAGQVKVEDAAEVRFGAAQVMLVPDNEMAFAGSLGGRVQPDGSFLLTNTSADHYRVQISGMPEGCYLKAARLGDHDMLEGGATITAGAGQLEIALSAAGGQVDGAVLDDARQPASGATVVLVPDERRRGRPDLFRTAMSDAAGRFSMRGVAPGDYKLYAWGDVDQGAWQDPEFLKAYDKEAETVSVEEKAHRTVQLKLLANEER